MNLKNWIGKKIKINYNNMPKGPASLTYGDKIISASTYLTGGFVGFIWIILAYISKKNLKSFVRFHAYQSIFLSILSYLLTIIISILLAFLKIIPFIGTLVLALVFYLAQMPIILGYSLFSLIVGIIVLYLVTTALAGKYSELPWVSDTVKKLM
ncbi:MAG: hypothetical protein WC197_00845 [Candidatus Gastranaerophilaceae bacterium]|jgi:uncharacterized membrane protein